MIAYKCDVCGKYYQGLTSEGGLKNKANSDSTRALTFGVNSYFSCQADPMYNKRDTYEICDECYEKINNFIREIQEGIVKRKDS